MLLGQPLRALAPPVSSSTTTTTSRSPRAGRQPDAREVAAARPRRRPGTSCPARRGPTGSRRRRRPTTGRASSRRGRRARCRRGEQASVGPSARRAGGRRGWGAPGAAEQLALEAGGAAAGAARYSFAARSLPGGLTVLKRTAAAAPRSSRCSGLGRRIRCYAAPRPPWHRTATRITRRSPARAALRQASGEARASSAPGIDAAPPTGRRPQWGARVGEVAESAGDARRRSRPRRSCPTARTGARRRPQQRRHPQRAEDQADDPAEQADRRRWRPRPGCRGGRRLAGPRRRRRRAASHPAESSTAAIASSTRGQHADR